MRLKITWDNGDVSFLENVTNDCESAKRISDGTIFSTLLFEKNRVAINFSKARIVQLVNEDYQPLNKQ